MMGGEVSQSSVGKARIAFGYVVLLGLAAAVIAASLALGQSKVPATNLAGVYSVLEGAQCVGEEFKLAQSGEYLTLESGRASGSLRLDGATMTGELTCRDGSTIPFEVNVASVEAQQRELEGTLTATRERPLSPSEIAGKETPEGIERSGEETFGRLMLALAVVMLTAKAFGALISNIGQPHVMGEVLAGILLGPTLLGALAPEVSEYLFPSDIIPLLSAGADIGLAFYMFLVGLELDPRMLKGRVEQAALISHGSIAIPMAIGMAVAVPLFSVVGPSDKSFLPFAVFLGVSMSITAFPVLARILLERRMFKHPVGAMAIGAAAVDDVSAWGLLALATAFAGTGSGLDVVRIILLAAAFCAAMGLLARPLLARVSKAYDEAGHIPAAWISTIFVGVLVSAFLTQQIGIAAIFGAFVMGLIMPRRADLTNEITMRLEDFVVLVLLPLFFVVTGLKTRIGLIDRPELWAMTLLLIGVAVFCKWFGAMGTAKLAGFTWRESSVIGALMNTRGLTELIVLTIGLELGVTTPLLFTMLVLMALVTTFMTGPALHLLDPRGDFSAPPESEMLTAEPGDLPPSPALHSILVAPQDDKHLDELAEIAGLLAKSSREREIVLARVVPLSRLATGVATEERQLAHTTDVLNATRAALLEQGIRALAVAFTSPDPGEDLVRLAEREEVDLILMEGRRPLLGGGVPRGDVGQVLEEAECDVAVLVEGSSAISDGPVIVPFGAAEHDWAALELGAWIASIRGVPLKLLGRQGDVLQGQRDASRLLGSASLMVQQLAGVPAEPLLVPPGRSGVVDAARSAGLLVIGLSERWRDEGLGEVRAHITKVAPAPILFVRRGRRPGTLAPRDDMTRFAWSSVAPASG